MWCYSREGHCVPLLLTTCIRELESRGVLSFRFSVLLSFIVKHCMQKANAVCAVLILYLCLLIHLSHLLTVLI